MLQLSSTSRNQKRSLLYRCHRTLHFHRRIKKFLSIFPFYRLWLSKEKKKVLHKTINIHKIRRFWLQKSYVIYQWSKLENHMPIAQFFHKVESSQMSALSFKLFRLSYSVLTFKSLKAKIHLLSWNHLFFMCVMCTFWLQTKNTTESLLEGPGTHSPLFRCQSCYLEMCSICLLMLPHKVLSPAKNSAKLSWVTLGLLSASWSFFCPCRKFAVLVLL